MITIGIDHGYAAIKTRNFCFASGLVEYEHEPYTKKDVMEYDDRFYVIGSGRQPLIKDKTVNNNYYLLTLAAIAKELDARHSSERDILIAAGLPLTAFGRENKPFTEYLLRNGKPIDFRYEGKSYTVTIKAVELYPQGYAAILARLSLINGEPSVVLADIGGWTVDVMRIDNRRPNAATCRSLELGTIRCMDEIAEQVRRRLGLSLSSAQIEAVLTDQPCSVSTEVRRVVLEQGRAYTNRVLSAIAECGFDIRSTPVVFMGGGVKLMQSRLPAGNALCRPIILDDVRINAAAYERLSEVANG